MKIEPRKAIKIHTAATGLRPKGWYLGRCTENSVDIASENGFFDYISDTYEDDLPYWIRVKGNPQLMIPYTLDANDMRFATQQGFNSWVQFLDYLKGTFDILYQEGMSGSPKIMNIGLHCRLAGRPGRLMAVREFIKYVKTFKNVWFARRIDIADHWQKNHPCIEPDVDPYEMKRSNFIETFGSVFEHSSWIAERAYSRGLNPAMSSPDALHGFLNFEFRLASKKEKLEVLRLHPDLAKKIESNSEKLTPSSKIEQKDAGLTSLTENQQTEFDQLNKQYKEKFNHPFIISVKGKTRSQILKEFKHRFQNTKTEEFKTACREVEKIARLRIKEIFKRP